MTDRRPPPTSDPPEIDDLEAAFHAVHDGEADAEQRRLVARAPGSAARLDAIRDLSAALADHPVVDRKRLDRLRTAALDRALAPAEGPELTAPSAQDVVPLAPTRPRRRWPALPAVAAIVVGLVAIGAFLLTFDDGQADQQTAADAVGEDAAAPSNPADDYDVTASYDSIDDLRSALETTPDPVGLGDVASARGPAAAGDDSPDEALTATTTLPTTAAEGTESSTDAQTGAGTLDSPEAVEADPVASRCDQALRSIQTDLGPAQAAVVVEVEGQALLVLSNPFVDAGADARPAELRVTVLNAVSCVPLFGVDR